VSIPRQHHSLNDFLGDANCVKQCDVESETLTVDWLLLNCYKFNDSNKWRLNLILMIDWLLEFQLEIGEVNFSENFYGYGSLKD